MPNDIIPSGDHPPAKRASPRYKKTSAYDGPYGDWADDLEGYISQLNAIKAKLYEICAKVQTLLAPLKSSVTEQSNSQNDIAKLSSEYSNEEGLMKQIMPLLEEQLKTLQKLENANPALVNYLISESEPLRNIRDRLKLVEEDAKYISVKPTIGPIRAFADIWLNVVEEIVNIASNKKDKRAELIKKQLETANYGVYPYGNRDLNKDIKEGVWKAFELFNDDINYFLIYTIESVRKMIGWFNNALSILLNHYLAGDSDLLAKLTGGKKGALGLNPASKSKVKALGGLTDNDAKEIAWAMEVIDQCNDLSKFLRLETEKSAKSIRFRNALQNYSKVGGEYAKKREIVLKWEIEWALNRVNEINNIDGLMSFFKANYSEARKFRRVYEQSPKLKQAFDAKLSWLKSQAQNAPTTEQIEDEWRKWHEGK